MHKNVIGALLKFLYWISNKLETLIKSYNFICFSRNFREPKTRWKTKSLLKEKESFSQTSNKNLLFWIRKPDFDTNRWNLKGDWYCYSFDKFTHKCILMHIGVFVTKFIESNICWAKKFSSTLVGGELDLDLTLSNTTWHSD